MLFPHRRKPYLWDNKCPCGKVRVTVSGKWLCLLIKCNLVNADMVQSHIFLTLSSPEGATPLPIRAPRVEALKGMEMRGSTQSIAPSPFPHSPVLISPAEAKAVPHSRHGGPCPPPPSGEAAYNMPITFKSLISNKQAWSAEGENSPFQQGGGRKKSLWWQILFYFKRDGCLKYLQQSGRLMNGLSMDKVEKGIWYRHLSCTHL